MNNVVSIRKNQDAVMWKIIKAVLTAKPKDREASLLKEAAENGISFIDPEVLEMIREEFAYLSKRGKGAGKASAQQRKNAKPVDAEYPNPLYTDNLYGEHACDVCSQVIHEGADAYKWLRNGVMTYWHAGYACIPNDQRDKFDAARAKFGFAQSRNKRGGK